METSSSASTVSELEAKDTGYAAQSWKFDGEVTRVFDDMLKRSIPQYEVMRDACLSIASAHQQQHTDIVDLGCSRGEAIAPLVERFGAHNRYTLCDVSEPMLDVARDRFKHYIEAGVVKVCNLDLRTDYPRVIASVTMAVLTVQFTPIEYRQRILRSVFKNTTDGGCFIMVEKVLGASAEIDEMMVNRYYQMKADNDYSRDEIERKRLSLEGRLVPVTADWNVELLRQAGFTHVDCFWRWMNFAGWVAVKQ